MTQLINLPLKGIYVNFSELGINDQLLSAIKEQGYSTPTPIQAQAIPVVLKGRDLLASAQTGTGKTAGFVLPLLHTLAKQARAKGNHALVLILTPTRELAAQIQESIEQYGKHLSIRSAVVFGGVKINPQMLKLRGGVEILVATPGRLLDLHQQNAIQFHQIHTLVLDEADRMLDMGFVKDITRIIEKLPRKRQNLLFSATFSQEIRNLAKGLLTNPVEIDVAPRNTAAAQVEQLIHPVDKAQKIALLSHLILEKNWSQALVFAKTKHGANKLVKSLLQNKIDASAIHGNKSQAQRTKALADFKDGKIQILVATDIAARGIDIDQLPIVINFDLPQVAEDYVHRIGRTGRANAGGQAISLVCADEIGQLISIEKLIKRKIERLEVDDFEPEHRLPENVTYVPKKPAFHSKSKDHRSASRPRFSKDAGPSLKRSANPKRNMRKPAK